MVLKLADVTHVVHWIPPEMIRTGRKWFGRKVDWGYWELQTRDAYEAGRSEKEGTDFTVLDDPDSCAGTEAVIRDLTATVSRLLGRPVVMEEDKPLNGKSLYMIPGWHHGPVRWVDAPVYLIRPAPEMRTGQ